MRKYPASMWTTSAGSCIFRVTPSNWEDSRGGQINLWLWWCGDSFSLLEALGIGELQNAKSVPIDGETGQTQPQSILHLDHMSVCFCHLLLHWAAPSWYRVCSLRLGAAKRTGFAKYAYFPTIIHIALNTMIGRLLHSSPSLLYNDVFGIPIPFSGPFNRCARLASISTTDYCQSYWCFSPLGLIVAAWYSDSVLLKYGSVLISLFPSMSILATSATCLNCHRKQSAVWGFAYKGTYSAGWGKGPWLVTGTGWCEGGLEI